MCKNSGFRSRIQKSYKKFGIESKNLIIFSESIPNLYPLCFLGLTQIAQISQGFFVGGKSHGCSPILCFLGLTQITQISRAFFVGGKSHGCSMVCGFLWAHTDLTDPTLSFVGGKSHGGSTVCGFLWTHTDSTRFNKKIICGNL